MSDAQYSSPPAGRVSRLKASNRDAGPLADGTLEVGQTVTDAEDAYFDNDTSPETVVPDQTPDQ